MPRLFVAIDLPADITKSLAQILPIGEPGIRCIPAEQLHLTLHFLGDTPLAATVAALKTVVTPAFWLSIQGVGRFGSTHRGDILWAGIHASRELQHLHATMARSLIGTGYRPESRPYTPHLTLARCKPEAPRTVINDFLQHHAELVTPSFPVTEFSLYSSVLNEHGPVYRREETFPLSRESGP